MSHSTKQWPIHKRVLTLSAHVLVVSCVDITVSRDAERIDTAKADQERNFTFYKHPYQGQKPCHQVIIQSFKLKLKMDNNYVIRDGKEDEIISKRSLCVVLEIIEYLKENVGEEGIFRFAGRAHTRRKILASLRRGDRSTLRHYLDGAVIESAAALQTFLMHLREPLIPVRVQQLVLAENPGVPERMVASDALGLLRQDLSGRHLELLKSLLDLLYVVTKSRPTSELKGCSLPVALLPIFFDLKPIDVIRWKQVAATFNELIITAPLWLEKCGPRDHDDQPEEQPPHYMYSNTAVPAATCRYDAVPCKLQRTMSYIST